MTRTLLALVLPLTLATPALACGGSRAQVALFLGVLFVVPVAAFFVAQLTLLRSAQAALAGGASRLLGVALVSMTMSTVVLGMASGASLCDAGLAVFGVPLLLLQMPAVVSLARAVLERPSSVVL
jgi:hypothetical protein